MPCQCREHEFDSWSKKIPHAMEQLCPCTKITGETYPRACIPHNSQVHMPRALQEEKPLQWEEHTPQQGLVPTHHN